MWFNIQPLSSNNKWLRYDEKSQRILSAPWGAFTNNVDMKRWMGRQKSRLFVDVYKVNNVNVGENVVKKEKKLVNEVCEWPLKYDALTKPTRSCGLRWWSLCSLIILFPLPFAILILHGCIHIPKLLCRFDFTALNCKANVNLKISRWYS